LAFHSVREADHSPPSSAEVKEYVELYLHFPNTPPWRGAQLKHRDNFTFCLYTQIFHLSLLFGFSGPKYYGHFSSLVCATSPVHSILLDLITIITFGEEYQL